MGHRALSLPMWPRLWCGTHSTHLALPRQPGEGYMGAVALEENGLGSAPRVTDIWPPVQKLLIYHAFQ